MTTSFDPAAYLAKMVRFDSAEAARRLGFLPGPAVRAVVGEIIRVMGREWYDLNCPPAGLPGFVARGRHLVARYVLANA